MAIHTFLLALAPLLARSTPISVELVSRQATNISWPAEYYTVCKNCPYELCTNNYVVYSENITATCWTTGEVVGDDEVWLGTPEGCYVPEYDLEEYPGDFTAELPYCGDIPLNVTKQPAKVKYLTVGKWQPSTSSEDIQYYGRDLDLTVTCWAEGTEILGNSYWYRTTDNCHVSETGLYYIPNRAALEYCGPDSPNRANETRRSINAGAFLEERHLHNRLDSSPEALQEKSAFDLSKRWLVEALVGEEYAYCRKNPTYNTTGNPIRKTWEYNQTVITQCVHSEQWTYPNNTVDFFYWMLTTDWCYMNSDDFWEPPYDHYRYPSCTNWGY